MSRNNQANLFDIFIFLVVSISFSSVLLLIWNRFNPYYAVAIGGVVVGIAVRSTRLEIEWRIQKVPFAVFGILLIALIFRAQPYLYVIGAQDQGVYVNMSATYEKKGSTFITDDVRKKAIDSGLKEYYDLTNLRWRDVKKGEYEGYYLPGLYIKDSTRSKYVYQFYPLHPLWMALAGKFAGEDNRVYSLVFFSLLSIVAFYLLGLELSDGNKFSSGLVAVFLALNPLHAFFSKFPVSEIVALAFSSLGFFYLIKYYRHASDGEIRPFYAFLSAMLFGCMFFTRISGFMYMPFFYLLLLITVIFEKEQIVRKQMALYFMLIFILFGVSVAYGMNYSYPYSHDIYRLSFGRFFHSYWQLKLMGTLIGAGLFLPIVWLTRRQLLIFFKKIKININIVLFLVLGIIIFIAFYKAYMLGFTQKYVGGRWNMGGQGLESLSYSNIFVVISYLSPIGFAIFLYAIFRFLRKPEDIIWTAFIGFITMFWYFGTVIKFATPYQYYYARYLLSELVPYTLLLISLVLGDLFRRKKLVQIAALSMSVIIAIYFSYFTFYQFLGKSTEGAHESLKYIQTNLGQEDLLLIDRAGFKNYEAIKTALSCFYDLQTCDLREIKDIDSKLGRGFLGKFDKVFVVSQSPIQESSLIPINQINYKQGQFRRSNHIPTEFEYLKLKLYLYRLVKKSKA